MPSTRPYHNFDDVNNPQANVTTLVQRFYHSARESLPQPSRSPDTTGQIKPPNCRPRLTALLWEAESCVCFQVNANGSTVTRRDDNHRINGTALFNVAGIRPSKRDRILNAGNERYVEIGPISHTGVW